MVSLTGVWDTIQAWTEMKLKVCIGKRKQVAIKEKQKRWEIYLAVSGGAITF